MEQFLENFTLEGLTAVGDDGRVRPWLAKDVVDHGRTIDVSLRPGVRFHDGSPVPTQLVADVLKKSLEQFAGSASSDVDGIQPESNDTIRIKLKQPSQFVFESLEALVSKPGAPTIGTGPFTASQTGDRSVLQANKQYYLGPPAIARIQLKQYPTPRAVWADMLRGQVDMVYDVGLEELDSLQSSSSINVFSSLRHYQYVIVLNASAPPLRSPSIRRALNIAIDRPELVRQAMGGHGVPSSGPVWPHHWAAQPQLEAFPFDPARAAEMIQKSSHTAGHGPDVLRLRFTCLVAPDAERIALVVKRQLERVGVEMALQEISHDAFVRAADEGKFDAIISAVISGPSLVRPYLWWDTDGPRNRGGYSNGNVDAAFDAIRHSTDDAEYRQGVLQLQSAILEDPPAIFLAWDEQARAVSNRFDVVPGVDIIRTMHLWKPVGTPAGADKN